MNKIEKLKEKIEDNTDTVDIKYDEIKDKSNNKKIEQIDTINYKINFLEMQENVILFSHKMNRIKVIELRYLGKLNRIYPELMEHNFYDYYQHNSFESIAKLKIVCKNFEIIDYFITCHIMSFLTGYDLLLHEQSEMSTIPFIKQKVNFNKEDSSVDCFFDKNYNIINLSKELMNKNYLYKSTINIIYKTMHKNDYLLHYSFNLPLTLNYGLFNSMIKTVFVESSYTNFIMLEDILKDHGDLVLKIILITNEEIKHINCDDVKFENYKTIDNKNYFVLNLEDKIIKKITLDTYKTDDIKVFVKMVNYCSNFSHVGYSPYWIKDL